VRLIDDYEARFPGGSLAQEATVLRIEALASQGDRQGASALGDRFVAEHPTSPYAARVRQLLGGFDNR
jgi:outer membrane protein assembly factor BamD (BamD/ComL family)